MSWRSASERLLATARPIAPAVTVATAASAGAVFVADHALKYNVANLVTHEQFQKQSEQIQKQSEQLRADLRADLRVVPVLVGRTEELSKTTTALVTARERRPWW
jgi:7-keto-8-aminopelargonate synthetase-like enzyme